MPKHTTTTTSLTNTTIFNRYTLTRLLGRGTFAKVYEAQDLHTNTTVAIKVINKQHILNKLNYEQILREIEALRLVRHPNILTLHHLMATRSRIFIVTDLAAGGDLFAILSNGPLRENLARRFFSQLSGAVAACHARGVAHRDVKPENLLVGGNGELLVADFGLAALPEGKRGDGMVRTRCGTPAYAAPEVLRCRRGSGKGYDGAMADVWSCGVVLYAMVSGFLPFRGEGVAGLCGAVGRGEYEVPPWVSGGAQRLIGKMLVVDPAKRCTMEEAGADPWVVGAPVRGISMFGSWEEREEEILGFRSGEEREEKMGPTMDVSVVRTGEEKISMLEMGVEREKKVSRCEIRAKREREKEEEEVCKKEMVPRFFNAFELISVLSSGFDLSGLFGERGRAGRVFTSRAEAMVIVEGLERVGRALGFQVRRKGCRVKMENRQKGGLVVAVEVFEATKGVAIVEISKESGDTMEFVRFCDLDVRARLRDIVWTWHGEEEKCYRV